MAQSNIGLRPSTAVTEDFGGNARQGVRDYLYLQQLQAQQAERKRQAQQDLEDRWGIDESLYQLPDTEFRSLNDVTTEALSYYRDSYYETYKKLQKDPTNLELKKELGRISNVATMMKTGHQAMAKRGQEGLLMLENDEISGVDEERWREQMESYDDARVVFRPGPDKTPQMLIYNKEGKLQDVVSYQDLVKGNIIKKIDVDTELDDLVKGMGGYKVDKITGGVIRTEDIFGDKQSKFANDWIDSYIGTDEKSLENNDVLADLLNQATSGVSKKRSNFTQQDREYVKNWLMDQIKGRYDEETSLKNNFNVSRSTTKTQTASDLINISMQGSAPQIDKKGRFVYTIAEPIAIDPTKSDRKIDNIRATADGRIVLTGQDRRKVKGVSEFTTIEEVAAQEQVPTSWVERLLGDDGEITFYVREPFEEDRPEFVNKVGNMLGVEDELGLRNILYQDMVQKFGEEGAQKLLQRQLSKETQTQESKLERLRKLGEERAKRGLAEANQPIQSQQGPVGPESLDFEAMSLEELDAMLNNKNFNLPKEEKDRFFAAWAKKLKEEGIIKELK